MRIKLWRLKHSKARKIRATGLVLLISSLHELITSLQSPDLHTSSRSHKLSFYPEFQSFAAPQWLSHPFVVCAVCTGAGAPQWGYRPCHLLGEEDRTPLWPFPGGSVGVQTAITFAPLLPGGSTAQTTLLAHCSSAPSPPTLWQAWNIMAGI